MIGQIYEWMQVGTGWPSSPPLTGVNRTIDTRGRGVRHKVEGASQSLATISFYLHDCDRGVNGYSTEMQGVSLEEPDARDRVSTRTLQEVKSIQSLQLLTEA